MRWRLLIVAVFLLLLPGCMHRRVTIHSVPEGALLKVDGKDIGYTPAHFDFTWYGTREVQLLLDGYETRTEMIEVNSPWYQKFPLDFFSDNFAGRHILDHRQFTFQMRPRRADDSGDLINRGNAFRNEAVHGQ